MQFSFKIFKTPSYEIHHELASAQTVISAKVLNVLAMDQIFVKTPNPKCRLFLKIYQ
jgi:hypothetical protein